MIKKVASMVALLTFSTQIVSVGAYDLGSGHNGGENSLVSDIVSQYENDISQGAKKGIFSLQNFSTQEVDPTTLSDEKKDAILLHNINKYGNTDLKTKTEGLSLGEKEKALKVLKDSLKEDSKTYKVVIKSPLSQSDLQTVFDYFSNEKGVTITPFYDEYKSEFYELEIEKNSKVGKIFDDYLENGIVPENLFGQIEIVEPNLVQLEQYSTGFYQGETTIPWGITKIGADKYQYTFSKREKIKVGVLDTGIQLTHKDLKQNIFANSKEIFGNGLDDDFNGFVDDTNGYDFVTNTGVITDIHGHGTHVAGTIGAAINQTGLYGVNSNVELVAIKVLSDQGYGSSYGISRGIRYAADNGIKVINLSLGGGGSPTESDVMCSAVTYAKSKGTISVIAAGNNNGNVNAFVPGGCMNAFTVGALDSSYNKASFSNFGDKVDISAPGVNINSTTNNGGYGGKSGTSMASPHVAGAVAAVLASTGGLTIEQAKNALVTHSEVLTTSVPMGTGLNLDKALQALGVPTDENADGNNSTPTPNVPPSVTLSASSDGVNTYNVVADGTDIDGQIVKYDFFINNELLQSGMNKTFTKKITQDTIVKVVVTDNKGAQAEGQTTLKFSDYVAPTMTMNLNQRDTVNSYIVHLQYNPGTIIVEPDTKVVYEVFVNDERVYSGYEPSTIVNITKDSLITGTITLNSEITLDKSQMVKFSTRNNPPTLKLDVKENSLNNYTITANASDSDGFITKYEFRNGERLVQSGTGNVYNLSITGATTMNVIVYDNSQGIANSIVSLNYKTNTAPVTNITVKTLGTNKFLLTPTATDKENNIAVHVVRANDEVIKTSTGGVLAPFEYVTKKATKIEYTVIDQPGLVGTKSVNLSYNNVLPTVIFAAKRIAANDYEITSSGSDANGTIEQVEMYESDVLVYTGSTLPETFRKKVSKTTSLKLIVTDNDGGKTTKTLTLTYANILPTLGLTNKRIAANEYTVTASGTDANGEVVQLEIYENNVLVKTIDGNTFETTKKVTQTIDMKIVAIDNEGGKTTRTTRLSYANILPILGLTNKRIAANEYTVTASGTDANGEVVQLEIYENNVLVKTIDGNTFETTKKVTQTIDMKIVAIDNEGGKTTRTTRLSYANILPTVSVSSPKVADNTYSVSFSGSDANGQIVAYEYYLDNVLVETFTQASSKEQKVTKNTVLKVVAVDNEGGKASRTLTLYYRNVLPTLNITTTNPLKNYYEVNIDAQDANGQVVKYQIYENNVLVSTTTEKPTYTPTLTKNLSVTIVATDNEGGTARKSLSLYFKK